MKHAFFLPIPEQKAERFGDYVLNEQRLELRTRGATASMSYLAM
jgi:hypothetical protein